MHNPESATKFTADPRSTVFSKSAKPIDLPQKSTIRALFKAKSVDPKSYFPPRHCEAGNQRMFDLFTVRNNIGSR